MKPVVGVSTWIVDQFPCCAPRQAEKDLFDKEWGIKGKDRGQGTEKKPRERGQAPERPMADLHLLCKKITAD